MIVDFRYHFTPCEFIRDHPGDRFVLHYDKSGAPSYTVHLLLYDLDEHIRISRPGSNPPKCRRGDFSPYWRRMRS